MKNTTVKPAPPEEIAPELYEWLGVYIDGLDTMEGALIQVLHHAQELMGYLPRDVQLYIARKMNIPGAEVYGVVSFYSFFTMEPPGKHTVSICMGTACFVRGADKIIEGFKQRLSIDSGETTTDSRFTLKDVRCVGACGLAPVVMVDDKVFGRVTMDDIETILEPYDKEK